MQYLIDFPQQFADGKKAAEGVKVSGSPEGVPLRFDRVIFCGMGGSGLSVQTVKTTFGEKETKTLRDEFAMAALQGLIAETNIGKEKFAEICYQYADAMLRERGRDK